MKREMSKQESKEWHKTYREQVRQMSPEERKQMREQRRTFQRQLREMMDGLTHEMDKERLAAFIDAILAIIMTILVLELKKPDHMTWSNLWDLRANFFAYILSFVWLAAMWISLHFDWKFVKRATKKTAWAVMNLLLWCSFLPYATSIMAREFGNSPAQIFYGIIIVAITLSLELLYRSLEFERAEQREMLAYMRFRQMSLGRDMVVKFLALLISIFFYAPFMSYSILFSLLIFTIPDQLKK